LLIFRSKRENIEAIIGLKYPKTQAAKWGKGRLSKLHLCLWSVTAPYFFSSSLKTTAKKRERTGNNTLKML